MGATPTFFSAAPNPINYFTATSKHYTQASVSKSSSLCVVIISETVLEKGPIVRPFLSVFFHNQ
jgi:hypothetical protein